MRKWGAADQRAVAFAAARPTRMGARMNYDLEAARLKKDWAENPRWKGINRGFSAEDVVRLRGSVHIEHTLARRGAEKLWKLVNEEPFVNSLGAMTGNQAMQQVKAGLKAIYLSGWQVAADANMSAKCIRTSRCTRSTRCRTSSSGSTTVQRADQIQQWKAPATSIFSRRSSPMRKPVSAACSMRSN